jgi:hypothetical protein
MNHPLHNKLMAHLLATFAAAGAGDVSDDDGSALAHEIATATELRDGIAAVIRSARSDEVMAKRLSDDIAVLQVRKARLEARAERKRQIALGTMLEAGPDFARLELHDLTASVKATAPTLLVSDPTVLPTQYFDQPEPKLKRSDLLRDLKAGADILGATLAIGAPTLAISSK